MDWHKRTVSDTMFSDRFWIVKVALAFGAFVLLCRGSKRELNELRPDVEQATYESDRIKGRRTYLWAKVVTQVQPGDVVWVPERGIF